MNSKRWMIKKTLIHTIFCSRPLVFLSYKALHQQKMFRKKLEAIPLKVSFFYMAVSKNQQKLLTLFAVLEANETFQGLLYKKTIDAIEWLYKTGSHSNDLIRKTFHIVFFFVNRATFFVVWKFSPIDMVDKSFLLFGQTRCEMRSLTVHTF